MVLIKSIDHFVELFGKKVTTRSHAVVAGDLALVGTDHDLEKNKMTYNFWHVTDNKFIGTLTTNELVLVMGRIGDKLVILSDGLVGRIGVDYVTKLPDKPKRPSRRHR